MYDICQTWIRRPKILNLVNISQSVNQVIKMIFPVTILITIILSKPQPNLNSTKDKPQKNQMKGRSPKCNIFT